MPKWVVCFICGARAPNEPGRGQRDIICLDCFERLKKAFRRCYTCKFYKPRKGFGGQGNCKKLGGHRQTQFDLVKCLDYCSKWRRKPGKKLESHFVMNMLDLRVLVEDAKE